MLLLDIEKEVNNAILQEKMYSHNDCDRGDLFVPGCSIGR
jgi:hypothetical protein